jgi:peptidoglycan/LPS O-acetylase OafA/YrhL
MAFLPTASAQTYQGSPSLMAGFLASYRYVFAILVTYLLGYSLVDWDRSWVKAFLSSRRWVPIAEVSYGAYLLHPLIIISVYTSAPLPPVNTFTLFGFLSLNIILTLALAFPLYRFVERPLRERGRLIAKKRFDSTIPA